MLLTENKQLERELCNQEKRKETLTMIKEERQMVFDEREKAFREEIEMRQKNIHDCNQKYEESKNMKEELLLLVKSKGLGTK